MDIETRRLTLRPITPVDVDAVVSGQRQDSWADDFPADGDMVIARLLQGIGVPAADAARYGHRVVVERSSSHIVGGIGFFGPPDDGALEIGYGIVASRRGRGYATEAVRAMVADALSSDDVEVVRAEVDLDNPASIVVLERNGLTRCAQTDERATYEIRRRLATPDRDRPTR